MFSLLPWGPAPSRRGGSGGPAGSWLLTRGRNPSGGKDHFFFCGKRNGPSPQRKRGGRSTVGLGLTTAAFVFTHCLGTSPGRYGHPMVEQGKAGSSIFGPSGGATLAAECGGGVPGSSLPTKSPAPPQGMHLTTLALREAPAGGGGLGPPACLCSQTAGRNGREGSSLSYESRKPPFSPISPA